MPKKKFLHERKNMYIYPWYISDLTSSVEMEKIFGMGIDDIFIYIDKGFMHFYYNVESARTLGKFLLEKVVTDKKFFEDVVSKIYGRADELSAFCDRVTAINDISSLGSDELVALYDEYIEKLSALRAWGWIPVFIDGFTENFLTDLILKELGIFLDKMGLGDKKTAYYSILSTSEKSSEVHRESIERLRLAKTIFDSPEREKMIALIISGETQKIKSVYPDAYSLLEDHRKQYEWLTYAYAGPVMSMEYLLKMLADDFSKGVSPDVELAAALNRRVEVEKEKMELADKLLLPEELRYLFGVSSELMYMKDWRKGAYQRSYVVMDKVISEIAKRIGITLDEAKFIVVEEIREAFKTNDMETLKKKAKARAELCCYKIQNGKMEIWEGEDCKKVLAETMEADDLKTGGAGTVIKGMVAYKGRVKGVAKIVLVEADMEKLKEGEVLVSSATNPDLILAMKRAAAFVTDMGGIMSHAAIVSREMKKPCVVGTKNATRMIKDGDLVDVNADEGIVTIIK